MPWSQTEDTEKAEGANGAQLNDTMDVRIGLEHTFYNGMPLRFGFRHFDTYRTGKPPPASSAPAWACPWARAWSRSRWS